MSMIRVLIWRWRRGERIRRWCGLLMTKYMTIYVANRVGGRDDEWGKLKKIKNNSH